MHIHGHGEPLGVENYGLKNGVCLCSLFHLKFESLGLNETHGANFHFLQSPVRGDNTEIIVDTGMVPPGEEDASFPPLKSEDSGIGLSASSPELSEHLRVPRVSPEKDDVWKKGGSMQRTLLCIQELIANFAHKNIFGVQPLASGEEAKSEEHAGPRDEGRTRGVEASDLSRKNSWEAKPISVPQFKQMLSDLFTVRGSPFKMKSTESPSPLPSSPGRRTKEEWTVDQVVVDLGSSRESCREAFAAACHLLLDCATFPVYLSQEETERLCDTLFRLPGERAARSGHPEESCGWGGGCLQTAEITPAQKELLVTFVCFLILQ